MNTKRIAIFASGSGTNTQAIIDRFKDNEQLSVACILCNNKDAYVIERAKKENIDYMILNRDNFKDSDLILDYLNAKKVNFIVLAGFLWLIPKYITDKYKGRIINIHPALLPKYGGKGMYGMNVHKAVYKNKENKTGITIHHVNEKYDDGDIIFQAETRIDNKDTPESIAKKVHLLEYKHYPEIIEKLILSL